MRVRRFHLRLSWVPYSWIDAADAWLHQRGDRSGWTWVCHVKDRRLGWQDDERLLTRPKIVFGQPVRMPPRG